MTTTDTTKGLAARQSTDSLLLSLATVGQAVDVAQDKADVTHAEADHKECQALTLIHAWIVEALEARYPAAEKIMADRFDAVGPNENIDYAAELIAAVRKVRPLTAAAIGLAAKRITPIESMTGIGPKVVSARHISDNR
jgi:hypothetical protein